ncbi:hypothetical protein Gotri_003417, partial [Gossypium trilobum]|nr:hypothetical protein [Gossypium trilobum]
WTVKPLLFTAELTSQKIKPQSHSPLETQNKRERKPARQSRRRRSAADDGAKTIERSQGHRHLLYRLT